MGNRLKLLSVALFIVLAGYTGDTADGGASSTDGAESVSLTADASGSVEVEQAGSGDLPQA